MKTITEAWATDFAQLPITFETADRYSRIERFVNYCKKQNVGILALACCVFADIDQFEALNVFCGIHTNHGNSQRKPRLRSNCAEFNARKCKQIAKQKGISQRKLADMTGYSRTSIINAFRENKRRKIDFIEKCEKALGLLKGELIGG